MKQSFKKRVKTTSYLEKLYQAAKFGTFYEGKKATLKCSNNWQTWWGKSKRRHRDKYMHGVAAWHKIDKHTDLVRDYGVSVRWRTMTVHVYRKGTWWWWWGRGSTKVPWSLGAAADIGAIIHTYTVHKTRALAALLRQKVWQQDGNIYEHIDCICYFFRRNYWIFFLIQT